MGWIGDGYDNAMIESFWARTQTELVNRKRWKPGIEVANAIFDYLEVFHNRQRRHSALGMRTPNRVRTASPIHPTRGLRPTMATPQNRGHIISLLGSMARRRAGTTETPRPGRYWSARRGIQRGTDRGQRPDRQVPAAQEFRAIYCRRDRDQAAARLYDWTVICIDSRVSHLPELRRLARSGGDHRDTPTDAMVRQRVIEPAGTATRVPSVQSYPVYGSRTRL